MSRFIMKKNIKVSIRRLTSIHKIEVKIQVPKELEAVLADDIQISSKWVNSDNIGVEFYKPKIEMLEKIDNSTPYGFCFNDFGAELVNSQGSLNMAMVRVKGISRVGGISIYAADNGLNAIEIEAYIKTLGYYIKELYRFYLQKVNVKALICFEL